MGKYYSFWPSTNLNISITMYETLVRPIKGIPDSSYRNLYLYPYPGYPYLRTRVEH